MKKNLIFTFAIILLIIASVQKTNAFTPNGWDYNLTKRCVTSPHPGAANYYEDTLQCTTPNKSWNIAVQSEKADGVSCPGPTNQSFMVNDQDSPVSLQWLPHTDEFGNNNWSVCLQTDFNQKSHPCGEGYWTWYVFMDHLGHNGGPLPKVKNTFFSATVNFNDFTPSGATRAFAGWQGFWDGKARGIELSFASTNWGDGHPDPDIVTYVKLPDGSEFINMDGGPLGITVEKLKDTKVEVDWAEIVANLVSRGLLETPINWEEAITTAVWLGTETNNFQATNAISATLWFTNFRVEDKKPTNTQLTLSSGWNEITWPDVPNYIAQAALERIDSDCGTGTSLVIARKEEDFWEEYVKEFGGKNFNLQSGSNYSIYVSENCYWKL